MKEQNRIIFHQRFPDLAADMEEIESFPLELETARDGNLTARYKGHFLHSRVAPHQEAQRLAAYVSQDSAAKSCDSLVFLGWGLGYHIEACMKKNNPGVIFIIEPDKRFFRSLLELKDISSILHFENLHLCIALTPQEIIEELKQKRVHNPYVVQSSLIIKSETAYFHQLMVSIDRYRQQAKINTNTLRRFGKLWVRNLLKNLPVTRYAHGIESTGTLFSGFPAVLCAAGPTLDEILPFLSRLRQSALIIAVDTALQAVLSCGIEPDFLVVIDPQYWNTRHVDKAQLGRTVIVSDLSTHPRTFRLLPRSLLLSASIFPLGKRFDPPHRINLGAGGSVTTAAWDFARHLGVSKLYCAGVDMGFPDGRSHTRRTFYEYYWRIQENRTLPVETQLSVQIFSGNPLSATSYDGHPLQSDQRMELYYWWLHDRIKESPMQTFSLSHKSRRIEGVEACNPSGLNLPVCREIIQQKMDILSEDLQQLPNTQNLIESSILSLHRECAIVEDIANEGLALCKKFLKTASTSTRKQILKKLDILDKRFFTHVSKDLFGFLIQDINDQIFQRTDPQAAIDNSILVYQALFHSVQFHKDMLKKLPQVSEKT